MQWQSPEAHYQRVSVHERYLESPQSRQPSSIQVTNWVSIRMRKMLTISPRYSVEKLIKNILIYMIPQSGWSLTLLIQNPLYPIKHWHSVSELKVISKFNYFIPESKWTFVPDVIKFLLKHSWDISFRRITRWQNIKNLETFLKSKQNKIISCYGLLKLKRNGAIVIHWVE